MGAGWYVACEEAGRVTLPHGGRALLFAQYQLEEIARRLGLPALKTYFSTDPTQLTAYLHSQGIEADPTELAEECWHEPDSALPTLMAIAAQVEIEAGNIPNYEKVRDDLRALIDAVSAAGLRGDRFHVATAMPDLSDRDPPVQH